MIVLLWPRCRVPGSPLTVNIYSGERIFREKNQVKDYTRSSTIDYLKIIIAIACCSILQPNINTYDTLVNNDVAYFRQIVSFIVMRALQNITI